jgi:hypothetical protein
MRRWRWAAVSLRGALAPVSRYLPLTFASLLAACGGNTSGGVGGATCANGSACGGDIVGQWTIVSSCVTISGQTTIPTCTQPMSIQAANVQIAGTIEYRSDGTLTQTETVSDSINTTFPAACLTNGTVTMTCAQLNQAMQLQQGQMGDAGIQSMTCTDAAGGGCVCTAAQHATSTTTGTYTVNNGVLSETQNGGTPSQSDYCVQGTQLTESPHASSTGAGATQMTMSGNIVLQKQ